MTMILSRDDVALLAVLCSLVLTLCLCCGIWTYLLWRTRGFYVKKLRTLSTNARSLRGETTVLRRALQQDVILDEQTRSAYLETLSDAEDYDSAIGIALSAWKDMIEPKEKKTGFKWSRLGFEKELSGLDSRYRRKMIVRLCAHSERVIRQRETLRAQMQYVCMTVTPSRDSVASPTMSGGLPTRPCSSHLSCSHDRLEVPFEFAPYDEKEEIYIHSFEDDEFSPSVEMTTSIDMKRRQQIRPPMLKIDPGVLVPLKALQTPVLTLSPPLLPDKGKLRFPGNESE